MAKARKVKNIDPAAAVIDNARRIIEVRLDEMYQFAPYVENRRHIAEIHNLRIAAKRLRYTLEMFRFVFPKEIKSFIKEVKQIQSAIGDMRDADIMVETVSNLLADRAENRAARLLDIATASERGTIAQRKQRVREAATASTALRDDVALYTLIAHHSDMSQESYRRFLVAWRAMEQSDFRGRLRAFVGLDQGEAPDAEDLVTSIEAVSGTPETPASAPATGDPGE